MANKYLLFKKTRMVEDQLNVFLMNILQSGFLLMQALERYLMHGVDKKFMALKERISALEAENDSLRRQVELSLYHHMLLPGMRSDLIELLEGCDKIINKYESEVILWSIEKPRLPKKLFSYLIRMMQTDLNCVGKLVSATKAFFSGESVDIPIQHVYELEHQVDLQAIALKAKIFSDKKMALAHQLQLKEFVYNLEKISDMAEDDADKLKVIVAKHSL